MTTKILICDDSALARKQLAKALPKELDIEIEFAENGQQAIDILENKQMDLMFLDLTMPVLDGYETLETLQLKNITIDVIVVSGDIQPQAQARVKFLGAKTFVKKPIAKDVLVDLFSEMMLLPVATMKTATTAFDLENTNIQPKKNYRLPTLKRRDVYMEVANLSIGQAAASLACHFNVFVNLPLPNVNLFEPSELHMTMRHLIANKNISGVCQGFNGEGISGESLILLSDSSINELKNLMNYPHFENVDMELELLMDISNLLVSAFLQGLGEQAGVRFLQSCPQLLGHGISIDQLIESTASRWQKILTFEVSYSIENTSIKCEMLLMFIADSLPLLDQKLAYLLDS